MFRYEKDIIVWHWEKFHLTDFAWFGWMVPVKQRFHTIIKPERNGWFVGWVEEVPGTITHGKSLRECRRNLRDSLQLMLETHRDEARRGLDASCLQESIEIDASDVPQMTLA